MKTLTIYFSGTGNTKYIAGLFSRKMDAACFSIESDVDFSTEIKQHDTIAVCYPIYGSRVPLIMREFVASIWLTLRARNG
jgi:flavodoxin